MAAASAREILGEIQLCPENPLIQLECRCEMSSVNSRWGLGGPVSRSDIHLVSKREYRIDYALASTD
eukprot:5643287-Prymnesium_polylepis.1